LKRRPNYHRADFQPALLGALATIVLFNGNASDLSLMADKRLLAYAIGIAISLSVMAFVHPIEQCFRPVRGGSGSPWRSPVLDAVAPQAEPAERAGRAGLLDRLALSGSHCSRPRLE
jgi:hypothetical protein